MKLENFVKQTLVDIMNGVAGAKKEAILSVAPGFMDGERIHGEPQYVTFETAVTVTKEGGASIEVLAIGLDGNVSSEHVNKISFKVPVYFNALNSTQK